MCPNTPKVPGIPGKLVERFPVEGGNDRLGLPELARQTGILKAHLKKQGRFAFASFRLRNRDVPIPLFVTDESGSATTVAVTDQFLSSAVVQFVSHLSMTTMIKFGNSHSVGPPDRCSVRIVFSNPFNKWVKVFVLWRIVFRVNSQQLTLLSDEDDVVI